MNARADTSAATASISPDALHDASADTDATPGLTVAAVARRVGVAPATLRTWDRRYGLGPSQHAAGAHRRYSPADVAKLDHMRRLILTGVSPGEAARAALAHRATPVPQIAADTADGLLDADVTITPGRQGGGRVVAIPGGTPSARGLARAAVALDQQACEQIVSDTVQRRGVVWSWDHLLVPVLTAVGKRWEDTGTGIEVEHVLSGAVQSVFSGVARLTGPSVNARPVLLAGTTEETHTLPLWAVAAGLAERGVSSRMLGGRTPTVALTEAMKRTGPAAVFLWSQLNETADVAVLEKLPDLRPQPVILLAGPGWPDQVPRGRRVHSFGEALDELFCAVGN